MPAENDPQVRKFRPQPAQEPLKLADLVAADGRVNAEPVREVGGRKDGLDPTRYGDWEKNGRCIDF